MQLRPAEFAAEPADPFANDLLDRQAKVKALCRLINKEPGPAVLAVRADFGNGKTAFLRMCSAHLRNQNTTTVVEFNAWLESHTDDPLLDLLSALSNNLGNSKTWRDLVRRIATRLVQKVSRGLIAPEDWERHMPHVMREWDDLNEFQDSLQETLTKTVGGSSGKLVVLIDELDRCLPKYALGTLNAARNLLDRPGVVVVLGLNPREIEARIHQLYGPETDAETFLKRFVDYSIDLRRPPAESGGINRFLDSVSTAADTGTWLSGPSEEYTTVMIKAMVDRLGMSLRDTQQLIRSAAVSLDTLANVTPDPLVLQAFVSVLALRTGAPAAYHELTLRHDSIYNAAAALRDALSVTSDDNTGLQMVAVLILTGGRGRTDLTVNTLSQVMQPTVGDSIADHSFVERLWAYVESLMPHWRWQRTLLRDILDWIDLAK